MVLSTMAVMMRSMIRDHCDDVDDCIISGAPNAWPQFVVFMSLASISWHACGQIVEAYELKPTKCGRPDEDNVQ